MAYLDLKQLEVVCLVVHHPVKEGDLQVVVVEDETCTYRVDDDPNHAG